MIAILMITLSMSLGLGAKVCRPDISEGNENNATLGGFLFIDCVIKSCKNVTKITYEKTGINQTKEWGQVFEWINKTVFRALNTDDVYSLKNRCAYADFPTKHTLQIRRLILQDQGKWRCSVNDYIGDFKSNTLQVSIYVKPDEKSIRIEPQDPDLVVNQKTRMTCKVDGVYPKPEIIWMVNGVEQQGGTQNNKMRHDGLWLVVNTIQLGFATAGINVLRCILTNQTKSAWMYKDITLDIKNAASVLSPTEESNITTGSDSTFALHCVGFGHKPVISWKKDGNDIVEADDRYTVKKKCSTSICEGIIISKAPNPTFRCTDTKQFKEIYMCIITLEYPYQSMNVSPPINVYLPGKMCEIQNVGHTAGIAVFISITIILVIGVSLAIRKLQQKRDRALEKQDTGELHNLMVNNDPLEQDAYGNEQQTRGTRKDSAYLDKDTNTENHTDTAPLTLTCTQLDLALPTDKLFLVNNEPPNIRRETQGELRLGLSICPDSGIWLADQGRILQSHLSYMSFTERISEALPAHCSNDRTNRESISEMYLQLRPPNDCVRNHSQRETMITNLMEENKQLRSKITECDNQLKKSEALIDYLHDELQKAKVDVYKAKLEIRKQTLDMGNLGYKVGPTLQADLSTLRDELFQCKYELAKTQLAHLAVENEKLYLEKYILEERKKNEELVTSLKLELHQTKSKLTKETIAHLDAEREKFYLEKFFYDAMYEIGNNNNKEDNIIPIQPNDNCDIYDTKIADGHLSTNQSHNGTEEIIDIAEA